MSLLRPHSEDWGGDFEQVQVNMKGGKIVCIYDSFETAIQIMPHYYGQLNIHLNIV